MKNLHWRQLAVTLGACGLGLSAATQAMADISTKISGYGTLGLTSIDEKGLEYRSSFSQAKGATRKPDFGVDSRLGLQGTTTVTPEFSATLQLLGQRRRVDDAVDSNNDMDINFEWAYAQYAPTSNLSFRLGRVVLPAFMISDSRNVGYAQPWLRAPLDVYGGMPLTSVDGAQVIWRIPVGPAIFTVQPSFGRSSYNISFGDVVLATRARNVKSLNLAGEYSDWLVRFGVVEGTSPLSAPIMGLLDSSLTALPPVDFRMKDRFTSLGLQYDNGTALFMTEVARRRQNNLPSSAPALYGSVILPSGGTAADLYGQYFGDKPLAATTSYYVGGGWHFGSWLPMLVYGHSKDDLGLSKPTHSVSGSLRYDWANGVALKGQITQVYARDGTSFVYPDAATSNRRVNVYSVAVDFVF